MPDDTGSTTLASEFADFAALTGLSEVSAGTERRSGMEAIPSRLDEILNETQILVLGQIENFGWQLYCIRRKGCPAPLAILITSDGDRIGILEADGRINVESNTGVRT